MFRHDLKATQEGRLHEKRSGRAGHSGPDERCTTPQNKPQPFETLVGEGKATTARDINPSNTSLSPRRSLGAIMNVLATALLKI